MLINNYAIKDASVKCLAQSQQGVVTLISHFAEAFLVAATLWKLDG